MPTKDVLLNGLCTNFEGYTVTERSHDDFLADPDMGEACRYLLLFSWSVGTFSVILSQEG